MVLSALGVLQTSHVTPQQAGTIFAAAQPRLAVAHHLTVNDASRAAIIQDIRQGYPKVRSPRQTKWAAQAMT